MICLNLGVEKLYRIRTRRILIGIFITLCIGVIWQYGLGAYEKNHYSSPGQLIEVNTHKMHIYSKGEGSPTVIFTTGSGTPCAYTDYYLIQKQISKTVRTVSYDRPGYGWSEPTTISRSIGKQVEELHVLLSKAREKPPYILVGHSLASLEVIHYAQLYPEEVSGIVLIDGGNPKDYLYYSEFEAEAINLFSELIRITGLARAMGSVGIFPALVGQDLRHKQLPHELQQMDEIMFYNKLGLRANRDALKNMNENAKKVIENGKLGDIPLIILTAGESTNKWKENQVDLKVWSNNSKQEEVNGAFHYIHWSDPNTIIERIQQLIEDTRKK